MEKLIREFQVEYSLHWVYEVTISQIKKDIEELEKLGATHVEIDIKYDHYDKPNIEIKAISNRLETDEEYQQRVNKEKEIYSFIGGNEKVVYIS